jgi:hypothetical protein
MFGLLDWLMSRAARFRDSGLRGLRTSGTDSLGQCGLRVGSEESCGLTAAGFTATGLTQSDRAEAARLAMQESSWKLAGVEIE